MVEGEEKLKQRFFILRDLRFKIYQADRGSKEKSSEKHRTKVIHNETTEFH